MMPRKFLWGILFLLLLPTLSGCVTSGKIAQDVHFDGENTQAIALSPVYLPDPDESRADHAWTFTLKVSDGEPYFGLVKPNQLLIEPLYQYFSSLGASPEGAMAKTAADFTLKGCQGQAVLQVAYEDDSQLKGHIQYQNYSDNCSLVLDTVLPFEGRYDSTAQQVIIALDFKNLPGQMSSRSYQMTGQLQVTIMLNDEQKHPHSIAGLFVLEETGGQTYRFEDMLLSWDMLRSYSQFSISGTLAFSRYGKVQVVTNSPLISYQKDGPPFDGMLTFQTNDGEWRRLYFPKSIDPGAFRIDGSNGMKTMGKY